MNRLNYSFLNCARLMPPLRHSVEGQPFLIQNSEVIKWLIKQPEIMQKLFDMAVNRGVIKFNARTRMWQGVDYDN